MKIWLLPLRMKRSAALSLLQSDQFLGDPTSRKVLAAKRIRARVPFMLLLLMLCSLVLGADKTSLLTDRAAIEQVYYQHRIGEKPPFEQVLPQATLENLVRQDLRKETTLKQAYGVEITPAMLEAEVQRINTTTRAPEILAEIKTALGNDPARFARAMARPILVERLLREKFDNDDALHATQRRIVERLREELLAVQKSFFQPSLLISQPGGQNLLTPTATNDVVGKLVTALKSSHSNSVTETTWQLAARPAETNTPGVDEIEIRKKFGPNAQILSSPHSGGKDQKHYFEDLPEELQNVLRVQLRQPGDVSAVIETPGGFLLYVTKERTDAVLSVAGLSLPKRGYEQWLEDQNRKFP